MLTVIESAGFLRKHHESSLDKWVLIRHPDNISGFWPDRNHRQALFSGILDQMSIPVPPYSGFWQNPAFKRKLSAGVALYLVQSELANPAPKHPHIHPLILPRSGLVSYIQMSIVPTALFRRNWLSSIESLDFQ
ncbi:hypothetical protein DXI23_04765 [Marinobacter flavimaris]|uniref:Uncharacterized protein n=1 Tax=Marinobacter flavimaris TaxID=262076 RepID=A0A3D8H5J7_9GAMM|nr:hypothetical protein MDHKLMBL_03665 [Marinobacter flavimaris]RDU41639.1 hypothetical protein DXI23_04765 [Marinobacter flavimaris]